jgi:hypothetical protein
MMNGPVLRRIPYCAAVRRSWDLALFGAHGSEIFFTAGARVHIQHGLGAGKLVDDRDCTYGPKWALWEGAPKYDRMLEASHAVRRYAVAACPPLAGHISLVGDLRADRLLAADRDRACRRGLTACRGQSAARTKAVLYDLLGRPVPGSQPPGAA